MLNYLIVKLCNAITLLDRKLEALQDHSYKVFYTYPSRKVKVCADCGKSSQHLISIEHQR
jgi:hypothetical protein